MGFGGGNFASQDQTLLSSLLGQVNALTSQQNAAAAGVQAQDAATVQSYNRITEQILGQTPKQQKQAVNLGVMDFIKTSPQGLSNNKPNTGSMGLL